MVRPALLFLCMAVVLSGATAPSGRHVVGTPVNGVVAVVNSRSPSDDLYAGYVCAGVVIGESTVLTAAHCVTDASASLDVVVAADNLCRNAPVDGVRVAVSGVAVHPALPQEGARHLAVDLDARGEALGDEHVGDGLGAREVGAGDADLEEVGHLRPRTG